MRVFGEKKKVRIELVDHLENIYIVTFNIVVADCISWWLVVIMVDDSRMGCDSG